MTSISDSHLSRAGLLSDMILGFRAAMRGPIASDCTHVEMPEHFRQEHYLPRRVEFQHGARIGLTWRRMRIGAATARRESRNRQFRDLGIAYSIDRDDVRSEALVFLREAIAQADHFGRPDPHLVEDVRNAIDFDRSWWDVERAALFYGPEGSYGTLSPMCPTIMRAMGETGWTSLEAVYQAQKFPFDLTLQDAIRLAPDGPTAKTIAREHRSARRRDWSNQRVVAMVRATILRVEQDQTYRMFLQTMSGREIVEDTSDGEHNRFWGVASGYGTNVSGQIAMLVRDRVIANDTRLHLS